MMALVSGSIVDRVSDPAVRVGDLVDRYARRVHPAVLEQHDGGSVSSPLGVWLLLAACATGARGADREALELALGCQAAQAGELLALVMADPPPALRSAIAVWVRAADTTADLAAWVRGLPAAVQSGSMPSQAQADAWADERTAGLIRRFPLTIDEDTRIVLASALATRVSWQRPFELVAAAEHLAPGSPWRGRVQRLLWDPRPGQDALLTSTRAAGLVAVHCAEACEDLTVISVSADPEVPRAAVLEAALEVAAYSRQGSTCPACSLFELPVGSGHSWQITEREVPTYSAGQRVQRIAGVSLPAWELQGNVDLEMSSAFATAPALAVLRRLIGPRPDDDTAAVQTAVASFTRYGFAAAAITTLSWGAVAGRVPPSELGVERSATLRFDHPYAAIAMAGRAPTTEPDKSAFTGLPLFSAWINNPTDVNDDPAASRPADP
jgi:hypothetical protein